MKRSLTYSIVFLFAFGPLAGLQAANYTIPAVSAGDGFFHNEAGSSWDYFDSTGSTVKAHYEFWGTSDTLLYDTGYLQFSMDAIPDGSPISAATLHVNITEIYYSSDSPSGGYLKFVRADTANGQASQRLNGSVTLVELKDQAPGWLAVDITEHMQTAVDDAYGHIAFSANPNTSGYFRNAGFTFTSADNGSDGPYLSVTTVPEPAAFALAGGLVALGLAYWRRRARS